uniref:Uncharacterized protein n=1 Tax=Sinocyclocheilus anshuiensis TaxID=1608454 RepID=A0A671P7I6_9TELE
MGQHTLLHGEALFVVASTDAHNIALQHKHSYRVCSHFCGHALLIEDPQFPVAGNEILSYPPTFIMEDFLAWNFHVVARIRFAV